MDTVQWGLICSDMRETIKSQNIVVDEKKERFLRRSEVFLRKFFQEILSCPNPRVLIPVGDNRRITNYQEYLDYKNKQIYQPDGDTPPTLPKMIWLNILKMNLLADPCPEQPLALFCTCKFFYEIEKKEGWLEWSTIKDNPKTPLRYKRIMLGVEHLYPKGSNTGLFLILFRKLYKLNPSIETKALRLLPELCWEEMLSTRCDLKNFETATFTSVDSIFYKKIIADVVVKDKENFIKLQEINMTDLKFRAFPEFLFSFLPNLSQIKIEDTNCLISIDSKVIKQLKNIKELRLIKMPYVELGFDEKERPEGLHIYLQESRVYRIGNAIFKKQLPWLHYEHGEHIFKIIYNYWDPFSDRSHAHESELSIEHLLREREYRVEATAEIGKLYQAYAKQHLKGKDLQPLIENLSSSDKKAFYRLIYCFAQTYKYQTPFVDFGREASIFARLPETQDQVQWGIESLFFLPQAIMDMAIRALILGKIEEKDPTEDKIPYYWSQGGKSLTQYFNEMN